mgnify:CR=1 FL=1
MSGTNIYQSDNALKWQIGIQQWLIRVYESIDPDDHLNEHLLERREALIAECNRKIRLMEFALEARKNNVAH